MKKKRKITKKALTSGLIWTLIAVAFTGYILYHIISGAAPSMNTAVTVSASEKITLSFDAYIMRNETVLKPTNTGFCDYIVGDTDYSKDEAELARVYPTAPEKVVKRIAEIDAEYELLSESARLLSNVGNVKKDIDEAYRDITFDLSAGNVKDVNASLDSLLADMYLREHNTSDKNGTVQDKIDSSAARLEALEAERNQLCLSLGSYESVYAEGTGNFFHGVDGYEKAYSSADIDNMTAEDFEKMFDSKPEKDTGGIGTYMKDYTWYIAIPADESEIIMFSSDADKDGVLDNAGKKYSVCFKYTSGITLDMTLENVVRDRSSSNSVLLFSCATLPDGFDRSRRQGVEIELEEYSGYRISNKAITKIDGENGIWILKGGKVTRRNVEIIYQNEVYAIVKSQAALSASYVADSDFDIKRAELENIYPCLNDVYFLSDKGLYEGKLID